MERVIGPSYQSLEDATGHHTGPPRTYQGCRHDPATTEMSLFDVCLDNDPDCLFRHSNAGALEMLQHHSGKLVRLFVPFFPRRGTYGRAGIASADLFRFLTTPSSSLWGYLMGLAAPLHCLGKPVANRDYSSFRSWVALVGASTSLACRLQF